METFQNANFYDLLDEKRCSFPYLGVEDHAESARSVEGEDLVVGQHLHVRVVAVGDHLVPDEKFITIKVPTYTIHAYSYYIVTM